MPPPADDELDETPETPPPAPSGAPAAPPVSTALSIEAVRNSPEYREQAKAARTAARKAGTVEVENARLRTELEATRTAAEAQARESQAEQVRAILGDDGVATWEAIAELSTTDPVAAARQFADFGARLAQSQQPPPAPDGSAPTLPAGGAPVPPAPLPNQGVSASAPLGQSGTDNSYEQIANEAEARYQDVVKVVQGPLSGRNRITGKIRQGAIMDFLVSSVARTVGAREKAGTRR